MLQCTIAQQLSKQCVNVRRRQPCCSSGADFAIAESRAACVARDFVYNVHCFCVHPMSTSTPPSRPARAARTPVRRGRRPRAAREAAAPLPLFAGNGPGASVDDRICATIHEAVLDHRLPPGTKLKEVALAEIFGVTRAVIRKALGRLAHMRLVELRPNRGAVVASPSVDEARDLFAARRAIEGAIVSSLAP